MNQEQLVLRNKLKKFYDENFCIFSKKLNPKNKVLGVKMTFVRLIAKQYLKDPLKAQKLLDFDNKDSFYLEELMVIAIIIANIKTPKRFYFIERLLPLSEGWAVCDLLCSELKEAFTLKNAYWEFIINKFNSKKDYNIRFAAVMALHYFTDKKYLNVLLDKVLLNNSTSEFYAKMGIAWMIATLFCFHEKNVFDFLKNSPLSYEIKKNKYAKNYRFPPC